MKEIIKQGIEKWLLTIVTGGLVLLGTAVWDYFKNYYDMPKRMDAWEQRAKRDSLYYDSVIRANFALDSAQDVDINWLDKNKANK